MICFVMVVCPNAKVCMEHTSTFPTWSSTTNKKTLAPLGRRAAAKGAWRWTIGWWRSCTPRHRPVGAEAPRSLLEIDVFPGGKFPCPQTSCRMRLRSAFVPGGTMGHGVPLTKPPDQCTSISVSAPWFQWGEHSQRWNVNETDQPSCNTALKAEKNWPVPIFQIKAT